MITNDDRAWLGTIVTTDQFDRILSYWKSRRPAIIKNGEMNTEALCIAAARACGYEDAINELLAIVYDRPQEQQEPEFIKTNED